MTLDEYELLIKEKYLLINLIEKSCKLYEVDDVILYSKRLKQVDDKIKGELKRCGL